MSFRKLLIPMLALLVLALVSMPLVAQTSVTGDVTGTVTDSTGAIVPNATVTLKNSEIGFNQSTSTNQSGVYHFSLVKPGTYNVSASSASMAAASRNVEVLVGQVTTASLTLGVKGKVETVEVTSEAPLLQTENANITTTYNTKQIDLIPNPGNDITYIAQTSPGVLINSSNGGGYGNFTAFGLPATANLFTVNGNDEMDPYLNLNNSGATNLLLGANELQEAAVVSNGYTGQYGRQAGAQVNYATKSGSNNWHGNAQYFYNGRALNAADWFLNHTTPKTKPGFDINNQWAASFGGPIVKDKTFFFVDTEGLRYILSTSTPVNVPTATFESESLLNLALPANGTPNSVPFYQTMFNLWNNAPGVANAVPVSLANGLDSSGSGGCGDLAGTPTSTGGVFGDPGTGGIPCARQFRSTVGALSTEWLITTRIDHNFSDKDKFYGRYKGDHGRQPTYTDPINPVFNAVSIQPSHEGQLTETHLFTSNLVNQLIVSGSWYSAIFKNPNQAAALAAFPYALYDFDSSSFANLGGADNAFPQGRNVTQYQIVDDLSWTKGNHTFKFGGNYRRNDITDAIFGIRTVPRQRIFSTTDFFFGAIDQTSVRFPKRLEQPVALYSLGAYLQDEWRVTSNLKFTMALRVDRNSNPVCQRNCIARLNAPFAEVSHNPNTAYNQLITDGLHQTFPDVEKVVLQPRFGFAWNPLGHKSTVIRGGIGLFSDLYPATLVDSFARNAPEEPTFTLTFAGLPLSPAEVGNSIATVTACNAAFQSAFTGGGNINSFFTAAPSLCQPPDYNANPNTVKNAKYVEYNLQWQQAIGSKMSFDINYVGNHGYDLFLFNPFVNSFCRATSITGRPSTCALAGYGGLPVGASGGKPLGSATFLLSGAPYPGLSNVSELRNSGISNYNGLTASFTRRFSYGFQGTINYTYSHALDNVSNGGIDPYSLGDSLLGQLNPFNLRNNYSNADYDVRHNLTANYIWELPYKFSNKLVDTVLGGWSFSGTVFVHSAYPFSVINSDLPAIVRNAAGGSVIADFMGGATTSFCSYPGITSSGTNTCFGSTPTSLFNTDPTRNALAGEQRDFGNITRNHFRGPKYFNSDFSINKNFKLTERVGFRVGANFFNVFNHPSFANPTNDIQSGQFAQITSTVEPPTSPYGAFVGSAVSGRVIQLTGKITF